MRLFFYLQFILYVYKTETTQQSSNHEVLSSEANNDLANSNDNLNQFLSLNDGKFRGQLPINPGPLRGGQNVRRRRRHHRTTTQKTEDSSQNEDDSTEFVTVKPRRMKQLRRRTVNPMKRRFKKLRRRSPRTRATESEPRVTKGKPKVTTRKPRITTSKSKVATSKPKLTTRKPIPTTTSNSKLTTQKPIITTISKEVKATTTSAGSKTTDQFATVKKNFLQQTNDYRKQHQVGALKLNSTIESKAQAYAEQMAKMDVLKHDTDTTYGENIYYATSSPDGAVKSWYDEVKNYNFKMPLFSMSTGHFTAVVWKSTTDMGCGVAKSQSGKYYVTCKYYPPGNMMGQFDKNVLPKLS